MFARNVINKIKNNKFPRTGLIVLLLVISAQLSCSILPDNNGFGTSPVFYPPLPNQPRIQLLTTINAAWVQGNKRTGFSDFILGKEESTSSQLVKPYGVTYFKEKVLVVDTRGPGYLVLTADDELVKVVKGSGSGRMRKPINIFVDDRGNRFITDTFRNQVLMFDQNDEFVRAYGKTDQFQPSDVLVKGNKLYVADVKNHIIHVLDLESGFTREMIGGRGSNEGELFYPTNLSMSPEGNIIVSDTGNYRLQLFSPDGRYLRRYGEAGSGLGQFARPKGVAVDKAGRIYAVDAAFENIQLFDKEGRLLLFFGAPGNEYDNINLPADINIQYTGIEQFKKYADNRFNIEYLIFVTSQYGPNKITVYGFGSYNKS